MRARHRQAEAEPPGDAALIFDPRTPRRPELARDLDELRRLHGRERRRRIHPRAHARRGAERRAARRARARPGRHGHGRGRGPAGGVFRATAGLRDRFGAERCVDTPLAEAGILGTAVGLCMAGWRPVVRDAVRRVLVPVPRPADHARGPLPLAHGRPHGLPDHDPDAVRRRRARARAARRLARDVLRAHARDQGGDPVDAGRREGPARGGDPRPRSRRRARAEARTTGRCAATVPEGEHVVPLGQARVAREGTDVTLVAYGAMVPLCEAAADALAGEASVRGARHPLAAAARRGRAARVRREDGPRRARAGGAAHVRVRGRARSDPRREGDLRPAGAGPAGDRLRRARTRTGRSRTLYMPSVERVVAAARRLLA